MPKVESPLSPAEIAPAASTAPLNPIADIILAKNAAWHYDAMGNSPFLSKGGGLHKLDAHTATLIAQVVEENADGLTVPYLLACIAIESLFDPRCENGNYSYLGHTGSNPDKKPDGFDVGIAQLKLKYLMEDRKISVEDAHAFACDFTKAIPYMATTMKLLLTWSEAIIQDVPARSDIPPALMNKFVFGTGAYNFGRTGMKNLARTATTVPTHCSVVMAYEQEYAKKLNLPSLFADIEK